MNPAPQRALPSLDTLLSRLRPTPLPRPWLVRLAREQLARHRASTAIPAFAELLAELEDTVATHERSRLQPVINATGILAHTNLGRAPLAPAALDALAAAAQGYCNLEIDLNSGQRGTRAAYLESSLALLGDAEAATVVNNGAAALVLIVRHLTHGPRKEVLISRGELLQIGGGFRIPDILEVSGARLREVGTTNHTSATDYHRAAGPDTALLLRVHPSNFVMEGFVHSPDATALAAVARAHNIPFVEDLGSGALIDPATYAPVAHEPEPKSILRDGADLVCFSGDKLLGGPQAGVILGRARLVQGLKQDPLFRALRCDKLTLVALQATLEAYLHAAARRDAGPPTALPIVRLLSQTPDHLRPRAETLREALRDLPLDAALGEGLAQVGGGVCPRASLPSITLRLRPHALSLEEFTRRLRHGSPPVVAFLADGACHCDLSTVFPEQDEALARALRAALSTPPPGDPPPSATA